MSEAIDSTNAKVFSEVFGKIPLSHELVQDYAAAVVSAIRVNKKQRVMEIDLVFDKPVLENRLQELKNVLHEHFPFLEEIRIGVSYRFAATDPHDMIKLIWNNILYHVGKTSIFAFQVLQRGEWFYNEENLVIKVEANASYILLKKNIHKNIAAYIQERLGLQLQVVFEDQTGEVRKKDKGNVVELPYIKPVQTAAAPPPMEQKAAFTPPPQKNSQAFSFNGAKGGRRSGIKVNMKIQGDPIDLSLDLVQDTEVYVEGKIFDLDIREIKNNKQIVLFNITDGKSAVSIKFFVPVEKFNEEMDFVKNGGYIGVLGKVQYDDYAKELNIMATQIGPRKQVETRLDLAENKRVELHLHTQMSSMDAVTSAKEYIERAAKWGHKAIAITDHGVVQAFPEAMSAAKKAGIKVIYGVEAYLIDDLGTVVQCAREQTLEDEFVVFDLETTGLSQDNDQIIEFGAVKIKNGEIIDSFSAFVKPTVSIPEEITKLTGITNSMVANAENIKSVLPEFLEFCGSSVLVAHNAAFDMGFIRKKCKALNRQVENTVLDTLELSRTLFPELSKHKLNIVAEHLGVSLENHHRAVDDAKATAEILLKCMERLKEKQVYTLKDINLLATAEIDKNKIRNNYHAIILVKNQKGIRNLYELVSKAHLNYFYKRPRIPKSEYLKLQDGLMIGTACEAGEFYKAILENKPEEYIRELAQFYDYFEIQPTGNNQYLVRNGKVKSNYELQEINKKIVALGEEYQKPVVATCDVHFMEPEDSDYRKILMAGEGFKDAELQAPLYFRTTEEMLDEFDYLPPEKAVEVVVENPNRIADGIDEVKPIPDETFPPHIEGAEEKLREITMKQAHKMYGDPLPDIVSDRLERELTSIIKNGFAVMYIIAQKLVWKSLEDGYLVGSRGSVGSSFVATMAFITEVNPLPPHYLCPECKYSDFDSEVVRAFAGGSGCDMPDRDCPHCGTLLLKDGHDIPFETFLGFDGDKEPDIDLNFSGEYQAKAHAYTEELFGEGHVFKAGTIGTLADKTAYGFVRKYVEEKGLALRNAEISRLKYGCTGVKRTTGQHPGGLMIVPEGHSIYEFCPVQRPANDVKSNVTTTHFDYHSISGRLLKLDILGHDVPTIIRMLHDITGVDPQTVDLGAKDVMSLFTSPKALGVTPEEIQCKTGSLGLPEFGTTFVRQMLLDTQPSTFGELVRISGLSHGTDVWFNNAQDLIKEGTATLKEVIPTRDDIMVYLINKGVEKLAAFKIMENVRKGKGLKPEEVETMENAGVPEWYIESCRRIKYMFPKGHAVAYVMMTVRIGYFKIHFPYSFYAACFSVKAEDFDYQTMCQGIDGVRQEMARINALGKEATAKDKNKMTILELALEMYARGLKFLPLDIYQAEATKFQVTDEGLLAPLSSIQGLGTNAALSIVEARKDGEFITIEDFRIRTKVNKTVIELLKQVGVLNGLPETSQLSLF